MIAAVVTLLLALQTSPTPLPAPSAPPDVPPLGLQPTQVLERYASALATVVVPRVVTFEYTVEQTGARDLLEQHRIFRSGTMERDEILAVDGRALTSPLVRVVRKRVDRYAVTMLAPRAAAYAFRFVGTRRDGRHQDYIFRTAARAHAGFRITGVTIDGASFLPDELSFATDEHGGSGTVAFQRVEAYWVPVTATARATYAQLAANEKISFVRYRFPSSLPTGTFAAPRPGPGAAANEP